MSTTTANQNIAQGIQAAWAAGTLTHEQIEAMPINPAATIVINIRCRFEPGVKAIAFQDHSVLLRDAEGLRVCPQTVPELLGTA